jgi:hypothetical protein
MLFKGFVTIVMSSLFFGFMGGLIGMLIGLLIPQYYETIYPGLSRIGGDPWKMGVALGAVQGLVAGICVGSVVLLSTAWYKSRMTNSITQMVAQAQALQSTSPEVELTDDVDLSALTKTKANSKNTPN